MWQCQFLCWLQVCTPWCPWYRVALFDTAVQVSINEPSGRTTGAWNAHVRLHDFCLSWSSMRVQCWASLKQTLAAFKLRQAPVYINTCMQTYTEIPKWDACEYMYWNMYIYIIYIYIYRDVGAQAGIQATAGSCVYKYMYADSYRNT